MTCTADEILERISPPEKITTFCEVEEMVVSPNSLTLCLRSSFHFIQEKIFDLVKNGVDGDIVLVGVWKGGLALYIQSLLIELGETHRKLILCDTFSGFVSPDKDLYVRDYEMYKYFKSLRAPAGSPQEIESIMHEWGINSDSVRFFVGDIAVTSGNIMGPLSFLIVDVDFFQPTMGALEGLCDQVSPGGYVYIDDYGVNEYQCKEAVDNFLSSTDRNIELIPINDFAVFWKA